jgi:hypothetical protein
VVEGAAADRERQGDVGLAAAGAAGCSRGGWLLQSRVGALCPSPERVGQLSFWPCCWRHPVEGVNMSDLIVLGYDNPVQARSAYDEVLALQSDFVAELRGLAIVTVDAEGKSHVETPTKIVGMGAASGVLWGMLIGLLFLCAVLRRRVGWGVGRIVRKDGEVGGQ